MDLPLLNRKQLAGLLQFGGIDTGIILSELNGIKPENFTSINLGKSSDFDYYPLAHRYCYDTFFKGNDEDSLGSEKYVQFSFTKQPSFKTVSLEELSISDMSVKTRLRRLQKETKHYILEADDTQYTELNDDCPVSVRDFVNLIRDFGDTVTRVRLAGLAPGHEIKLHRDHDPTKIVRFHIPIITNEQCVIQCEDSESKLQTVHLKSGEIYLLNTGRKHCAKNNSDTWRIHLLIDVHGQNFLQNLTSNIIID